MSNIPILDNNYFKKKAFDKNADKMSSEEKYKGFIIRIYKYPNIKARYAELLKTNPIINSPEIEMQIKSLKQDVLFMGIAYNTNWNDPVKDNKIRNVEYFSEFTDNYNECGRTLKEYIDIYTKGITH